MHSTYTTYLTMCVNCVFLPVCFTIVMIIILENCISAYLQLSDICCLQRRNSVFKSPEFQLGINKYFNYAAVLHLLFGTKMQISFNTHLHKYPLSFYQSVKSPQVSAHLQHCLIMQMHCYKNENLHKNREGENDLQPLNICISVKSHLINGQCDLTLGMITNAQPVYHPPYPSTVLPPKFVILEH